MATTSVTCSRCQTSLALDRSEKAYCPDFHGVWSSRGSRKSVHRPLNRIETSADEAMHSPQHGMGMRSCPACHKPTRAQSFFTVPIDWCPACGGVWLDGGVLDALKRHSAHDESTMLAMRFEDGSTADVFASVLFRAARRGTLCGDEGYAHAEGTLGPWVEGSITVREEALEYTPTNPYVGKLGDFANAVREGRAPAVDGRKALRNVELLARAIP